MGKFKNRIRELREYHQYTQAQLADMMGVNKQTISQYERGVREPQFDNLLMLCDIFNVSADFLLGRDGVTMRLVDKEEMMIIDAYRAASTDIKNATCAVLGVKRDPGIEQDADYLGA